MKKASSKAALISSSVPVAFAGSGVLQCSFSCLPRKAGQLSAAAASQTVITKSKCSLTNSSHDLLLGLPGSIPWRFRVSMDFG